MHNTHRRELQFHRTQNGREPFGAKDLGTEMEVVDTSVTPIEGTASNMELVAGQLPKPKDLGLCEA